MESIGSFVNGDHESKEKTFSTLITDKQIKIYVLSERQKEKLKKDYYNHLERSRTNKYYQVEFALLFMQCYDFLIQQDDDSINEYLCSFRHIDNLEMLFGNYGKVALQEEVISIVNHSINEARQPMKRLIHHTMLLAGIIDRTSEETTTGAFDD